MTRERRRRRLTVGAGVWAAAIAATATAGVAVAAGTQLRDEQPRPQPSTATPTQPSATPSPAPAVPSASASGAQLPDRRTPEPAQTGLCRAYLAKKGVERGKSLDTPAFRGLIEAAGGRDRVTAYCEQAVAAKPEPGKERHRPEHANTAPPGRDPSKTPGGGPKK
ncbi:hypothetical protein [Micromonospora sp. NPDC049679]|uniref:hypothetical protein n=1 Tax=Micromonospora sp. NPDC049679 TaxID=3155920 RepID=UPI0033DBDBE9